MATSSTVALEYPLTNVWCASFFTRTTIRLGNFTSAFDNRNLCTSLTVNLSFCHGCDLRERAF